MSNNSQTTHIKDEIWILVDNRPGTASQGIGLAEEIGFDYKIINLTYSIFARLPNFFFGSSLLRLSCESKKQIKDSTYLPSVVISAGRRSAPIALFLKKKSQKQTKIIQIMNPNLNLKKFDFVILPKHDEDKSQLPNVISTIGSLTKTDDNLIAREKEKFAPWFQEWFQDPNKIKIALLVGGSSGKTTFDKESAVKLAKTSSEIANNMNATLIILTSRRTGPELTDAIKSNLQCDFKLFDWDQAREKNPYLAILGYADFFVITGDSVSMISECCSTGKPVYIFDEKEISSDKHRRFHQNLLAENYAKKISKNLVKLENYSPQKLKETKRVALAIRSKLSS